jgi:copper homeostasis protein
VVEVEIAVQDAAGARAARDAGADRVELCTGLVTGGLTPSLGLIEAAVAVGLPVHPLVRTRPGGFVHDADELAVMVRDVRVAVAAGAAGVVVGALRADAEVDSGAVRALVDAAAGARVTFHRAFDVVPDRLRALDLLAELGITRVLTSGGAPTAPAGLPELGRLARHSRHSRRSRATSGAVQVMVGGGVRVGDVAALVAAGVDAVHLSARRPGRDLGAAGPGGGASGFDVTDADVVRAVVAVVAGPGSGAGAGPAVPVPSTG